MSTRRRDQSFSFLFAELPGNDYISMLLSFLWVRDIMILKSVSSIYELHTKAGKTEVFVELDKIYERNERIKKDAKMTRHHCIKI